MNANCYKCTKNLCELMVVACDNTAKLKTPFVAEVDGLYQVTLNFLKKRIIKGQRFLAGEPLIFDVSNINENYCYSLDVSLNGFTLSKDGFSNFTICTTQEYSMN
jgi:hypothetical protein